MNLGKSLENSLCIIPCGKDKSLKIGDPPKKAREAYSSPFFTKTLSYAEKFHPNSYRILSTKYGLLRGNDEIEWYEEASFTEQAKDAIRKQIFQQGLDNIGTIIALVSSQYFLSELKKFLPQKIFAPFQPFFHLGDRKWDPMIRAVQDRLSSGKPFDLPEE